MVIYVSKHLRTVSKIILPVMLMFILSAAGVVSADNLPAAYRQWREDVNADGQVTMDDVNLILLWAVQ